MHFFRDSEIKYFLADRASIYTAIEKDLCEFFLVRASCWFHARHYLEDAYVSDPRVYDIIEYINFLLFLQDGRIELSNNAIERCFRHIAMGRRNWLHTGSHFAAENIAFIYSLVESCKLNKIEFGEYIEDILTRFMNGEDADESFLPNHYTPRLVCE